jgi:hypothetical protein
VVSGVLAIAFAVGSAWVSVVALRLLAEQGGAAATATGTDPAPRAESGVARAEVA